MRQLMLTQVRTQAGHTPGDFRLLDREKEETIEIGNYMEVVLHRKLGVIGTSESPSGPQDIRGYELVIHHSAIHGEYLAPEMVYYPCLARTVDNLLRDQAEGAQLNLRPVQLNAVLSRKGKNGKRIKGPKVDWFVIAVDGVYKERGNIEFVPHNPLLEQ